MYRSTSISSEIPYNLAQIHIHIQTHRDRENGIRLNNTNIGINWYSGRLIDSIRFDFKWHNEIDGETTRLKRTRTKKKETEIPPNNTNIMNICMYGDCARMHKETDKTYGLNTADSQSGAAVSLIWYYNLCIFQLSCICHS